MLDNKSIEGMLAKSTVFQNMYFIEYFLKSLPLPGGVERKREKGRRLFIKHDKIKGLEKS